jgi:glutamate N-acetyltransferase/amino-acid N-acetyltransferase
LNLPLGYQYSSVFAGIRKVEKDDLALIASDRAANAAAVFTQNQVVAAPVKLARTNLKRSKGVVKAILINAGNANCATRTGTDVAVKCCASLAQRLKVDPEHILPASTGVIGVEMDEKLVIKALPRLIRGMSPSRFEDVAKAILTTDLAIKVADREVMVEDGLVRVAGLTKGSGMIQPNMATTLGFIMTDADLTPRQLREMLDVAVNRSYNRISVDGDTSTNDTLVLMANGAAKIEPGKKDRDAVQEAICEVAESLAQQITRDGEGARKLITIHVTGAEHTDDAVKIARSIANSLLVKTAIAGSDPNWGRILSAAGNAGVDFDPRKVDIELQGVAVCERGVATPIEEAALKQKLDAPECEILFAMRGKGKAEARFWTCDLTEKYIEINASYRT